MVMPIVHHTLPTVVAIGATTRVAEKALGTQRRRSAKPVLKKRKVKIPVRTKVRKRKSTTKVAPSYRKVGKASLPPGKWVQLSREELVYAVGKSKADKVKAGAGKAVKVGMYDKAIYVNGKYYLSIS